MKKENVTHRGVIESVGNKILIIRTEDECRCDGCAVVALCNTKDKSSELLTIDTPHAADFVPGDRVEVTATSSSTLRATWWALVLPTLIFVGVILGARLGFPSLGGWSIAVGFVALGLYDLVLYKMRRKLAQKMIWEITKI